jgi:hypothetical protein
MHKSHAVAGWSSRGLAHLAVSVELLSPRIARTHAPTGRPLALGQPPRGLNLAVFRMVECTRMWVLLVALLTRVQLPPGRLRPSARRNCSRFSISLLN